MRAAYPQDLTPAQQKIVSEVREAIETVRFELQYSTSEEPPDYHRCMRELAVAVDGILCLLVAR